jgi:hypothetical protein
MRILGAISDLLGVNDLLGAHDLYNSGILAVYICSGPSRK